MNYGRRPINPKVIPTVNNIPLNEYMDMLNTLDKQAMQIAQIKEVLFDKFDIAYETFCKKGSNPKETYIMKYEYVYLEDLLKILGIDIDEMIKAKCPNLN